MNVDLSSKKDVMIINADLTELNAYLTVVNEWLSLVNADVLYWIFTS